MTARPGEGTAGPPGPGAAAAPGMAGGPRTTPADVAHGWSNAEAFDSHCHLDLLDPPMPQVLADAAAAGINRVVTVGYNLESSRWAAQCAADHPAVAAAVAIHPNETGAAGDGAFEQIARLASLPHVRAIGETGLDYYRDWSDRGVQRDWFRAHIGLAKQMGKALVIHDREAHGDVLRILADEGPPPRVVFHCFSGDEEMVKVCAAAGYVMSFAGNVTFANAGPLREAARAVPPGLLLVETDAPYLTPVPYRGKPNAPAMIPYTLRCIAEVKGIDPAELAADVMLTGERVFGPW
ncbi:MAG TPA: TatD family hydrolase [Streptosporangiaceae bacterium]|nr:TatD family hydrolase [Streptosporangiaceae bacterium]